MSENAHSEMLSNRQRELLELVGSGVTTSKDLAEHTGLSPMYIDKVLHQAAKQLGVRDRHAAVARLKIIKVSDPRSDVRAQPLSQTDNLRLSEPASGEPAKRTVRRFLTPPKLGGEYQNLPWDEILRRIFKVALLGLITVMALVLIVLGFFRTFG